MNMDIYISIQYMILHSAPRILILLFLTSAKAMKEPEGHGISWRYLASPLDPNSPEEITARSHR